MLATIYFTIFKTTLKKKKAVVYIPNIIFG